MRRALKAFTLTSRGREQVHLLRRTRIQVASRRVRRALAYGLFALLVIALIAALQASAAPAASGVFSLDRLRLGGSSGAEDYVFTAGERHFSLAGGATGSHVNNRGSAAAPNGPPPHPP